MSGERDAVGNSTDAYGNRQVDAFYTRDASGNITGLVKANGNFDLRPKVQTPGGIFCDWAAYNGTLAMVSTDAADDIALDTTVTLDGYPTAKCTFTTAASGTFIADYTFANAISLKNFRTIQVPVKITGCDSGNTGGVGTGAAPFQLWLTLSGGDTIRLLCDFTNIPPNQWAVFSWSRSNSSTGMVTFSGAATWASLDSQTITKIRIVQATSAATSNNYPVWLGPVRCDARARGYVSIVMDGTYISQYSLIKPLLDAYNFKASLAIVNSFIGSSASYMTLAQVQQMYDEGHECIHHTYDGTKTNGYLNATDWPAASDISADIKQGFDYFRSQGWVHGIGKAVNAFANPFTSGQTAARHKLMFAAMQAANVECSRASVPLYTQQPSLGYRGVRPFHLPGAIQITNTNTTADVQAVVDQAETNGEWAIITAHRAVDSSPSTLEMTTANFATWLAYLNTRVQAGGITVAPMGEVFDRFYK